MVNKAISDHFKIHDPIIFAHLHLISDIELAVSNDPFYDLVESITSQQLSEKAGATIFGRILGLLPKKKLTPEAILALSDEALRQSGVSWSKVSYIKAIAQAAKSKSVAFDKLGDMPDEEVIAHLTQIRGVGRWTAEMFLMFSLARPDIFSHGDLGLRRGIQKLYKFKKEPTKAQIDKIIRPWTPYRTYASRILWRSLDAKT